MRCLAIVIALLAAAGCKKREAERSPPAVPAVPAMPEAEVQRSRDACAHYVERVCACAATVSAGRAGSSDGSPGNSPANSPDNSPATELAKQCELARALPDAVRIGLEVAASPDSKPEIVQQAYASVRKTAKECIEQTAKLPALGCR